MSQQYPLRRRASATQIPAHRAGHSSHIHPEDQSYWTDQQKKYANPLEVADGLDYPGEPTRPATSARRYYQPDGSQVIESENKRIIVHQGKPPRRIHWLAILGIGMFLMLLLWALLSWFVAWVQNNQLNATYEFPRISQADAEVYPGDSPNHPSHYFFINLNGTISIVEFVHGDPTHARVYKGPTLFSDNADQIPVTGEFRVVNGKIEMLVHIQDRIILYINNGTQFIPQ